MDFKEQNYRGHTYFCHDGIVQIAVGNGQFVYCRWDDFLRCVDEGIAARETGAFPARDVCFGPSVIGPLRRQLPRTLPAILLDQNKARSGGSLRSRARHEVQPLAGATGRATVQRPATRPKVGQFLANRAPTSRRSPALGSVVPMAGYYKPSYCCGV